MREFKNVLVYTDHGECSSPAKEITRRVLQAGHDLVIWAERDSQRRGFRASAAVELSRLCPCTLWIVRAPRVPLGQRVLAAVNPDGSDQQIDIEILDTALGIAGLLGRTLHVVHTWQAHGIQLLASRTRVEELAGYVEATMQRHRRLCEALMSRYAGMIPRQRLHLRRGPPAETILGVAAELDADPIVIGTAARRGLAGVLVGNTAERIMRRTDRSVVVVKPRDFTSPVAGSPGRAQRLPRARIARKPYGARQRGVARSRAPAAKYSW